jgi:hypothetical protein
VQYVWALDGVLAAGCCCCMSVDLGIAAATASNAKASPGDDHSCLSSDRLWQTGSMEKAIERRELLV